MSVNTMPAADRETFTREEWEGLQHHGPADFQSVMLQIDARRKRREASRANGRRVTGRTAAERRAEFADGLEQLLTGAGLEFLADSKRLEPVGGRGWEPTTEAAYAHFDPVELGLNPLRVTVRRGEDVAGDPVFWIEPGSWHVDRSDRDWPHGRDFADVLDAIEEAARYVPTTR